MKLQLEPKVEPLWVGLSQWEREAGTTAGRRSPLHSSGHGPLAPGCRSWSQGLPLTRHVRGQTILHSASSQHKARRPSRPQGPGPDTWVALSEGHTPSPPKSHSSRGSPHTACCPEGASVSPGTCDLHRWEEDRRAALLEAGCLEQRAPPPGRPAPSTSPRTPENGPQLSIWVLQSH